MARKSLRQVAAPEPAAPQDDETVSLDGGLDADARQDSSLTRLLSVLGLFSAQTPSLTVDQIATQMGVPKSTSYRYVQALTKAGLLVRLDKSITLGPRIIELDRSIRESDPVIRAAVPPMRELADQTGLDVFISKLYGHSLVTVHTEFNESQSALRYGRGRPVPLTRGSSSKALMAFLPAARLRRLYQELEAELDPPISWDAFYEEMQGIRKAGFCRTTGELNKGRAGISAPIYGRGRTVVASLTALGTDARVSLFDPGAIAALVMQTAAAISARLSADSHL
jgi:DNA-binding IclR family transcriptional regulator